MSRKVAALGFHCRSDWADVVFQEEFPLPLHFRHWRFVLHRLWGYIRPRRYWGSMGRYCYREFVLKRIRHR